MRRRRLRVVAHNASFDMRMLKQTARAHGVDDAGVDALDKRDFFCTMGAARDNCGLRNRAGRKRSPSNAELYERLLGKPPEGRLHDASSDVAVTAASYAAVVPSYHPKYPVTYWPRFNCACSAVASAG